MEGEREREREMRKMERKAGEHNTSGFFSGEGGEGEEQSDRGEGRRDVT